MSMTTSRADTGLMRPTIASWNVLLAVATSIAVFIVSISALFRATTAVVIATMLIGVTSRLVGALKKDLEFGLLSRPFAPDLFWYRVQLGIRVSFMVGWGALAPAGIAFLPLLRDGADHIARIGIAGLMLVSVVLWLVPRKTIFLATNAAFSIGVLAMAALRVQALLPRPRDRVVLDPPFRSEMAVGQGGDAAVWNHHYFFPSQRHAVDVVVLTAGKIRSIRKKSKTTHASTSPYSPPPKGKWCAW